MTSEPQQQPDPNHLAKQDLANPSEPTADLIMHEKNEEQKEPKGDKNIEDKRELKDSDKDTEQLIDKLRTVTTVEQLHQQLTQDQVKLALGALGVRQGGRPEERENRLFQVIPYLDQVHKIPKN